MLKISSFFSSSSSSPFSHQSLIFLTISLLSLLAILKAAVFNVAIRPPTQAQKQTLGKLRRGVNKHHEGFVKHFSTKQMNPSGGAVGEEDAGESTEIDDVDITSDPYYYRVWLNPQGTIKLGIPPQDFIVAFSVRSPDTFVAQSDSVNWENYMTFDETKSYSYSSDGATFQDSISANTSIPYVIECEQRNTGVVGKDIVTLGESLVLPLKFGLINNVSVQQCMDWYKSEIEGMFGLSLAKSVNGIPSTLQQIAPILDEPVVSVLTVPPLPNSGNDVEYHMKIGSSNIEGHCQSKDYIYFPSTSADIEESKKDGYHTRLWSVELLYPNGSFSRWNLPARVDIEFTKLVDDEAGDSAGFIYGDLNTVDEVNTALGGEKLYWQDYAQYIPCNGSEMPNIVLTMGNSTQKATWTIAPEEYAIQSWWFDDRCLSILQHHTWFGAWTSLDYHTQMCFSVRFGSGGNMIGMARPIGVNKNGPRKMRGAPLRKVEGGH